jgi:hypothetical protein
MKYKIVREEYFECCIGQNRNGTAWTNTGIWEVGERV